MDIFKRGASDAANRTANALTANCILLSTTFGIRTAFVIKNTSGVLRLIKSVRLARPTKNYKSNCVSGVPNTNNCLPVRENFSGGFQNE